MYFIAVHGAPSGAYPFQFISIGQKERGVIYIVDGTGPWSNADYSAEMAGSFCQQLAKEAGATAFYKRGPSLFGLEVLPIARDVVDEINKRVGWTDPIFLCGYSRGGCTVMEVAKLIRHREVKAMFLFDAVDRCLLPQDDKISGNVRQVYYAKRNPDFARRFEKQVESTRAQLQNANKALDASASRNRVMSALFGGNYKETVAAREAINTNAIARNADRDLRWNTRNDEGLSPSNFGNTGLSVEPPGRHEMGVFDGSHGALGGVPWSEYDVPGDAQAARVVRAWMWARFIKEGVLSSQS